MKRNRTIFFLVLFLFTQSWAANVSSLRSDLISNRSKIRKKALNQVRGLNRNEEKELIELLAADLYDGREFIKKYAANALKAIDNPRAQKLADQYVPVPTWEEEYQAEIRDGMRIAQLPPQPAQFLREGPLPPLNVPANLTGWLALFTDGDAHCLAPVTLTVKDVILSQGDGGVDKVPAVQVSATRDDGEGGSPLFMVNGAGYSGGRLKDSWVVQYDELLPGKTKTFLIGENQYEIKCIGEQTGDNSYLKFIHYRLVLTLKDRTQIIAERDEADENSMPYIKWVGDINRDGRLDLMLVEHSVYDDTTLFLSNAAVESLLTQAASWHPEMEGFFPH